MLSINECKRILEKHGEKHTDEEIEKIRDTLYLLAKHQIRDMENKDHIRLENHHSPEMMNKDLNIV